MAGGKRKAEWEGIPVGERDGGAPGLKRAKPGTGDGVEMTTAMDID